MFSTWYHSVPKILHPLGFNVHIQAALLVRDRMVMLEYERAFHALVDLVSEEGSLKALTSPGSIHPLCIDD